MILLELAKKGYQRLTGLSLHALPRKPTGVDYSAKGIDLARLFAQKLGYSGIRWEVTMLSLRCGHA